MTPRDQSTASDSYPTKSYVGNSIKCPFCGCNECNHFIGFTDDGKIIQLHRGLEQLGDKIQEGDRIVKTGVSARVYRERDWD